MRKHPWIVMGLILGSQVVAAAKPARADAVANDSITALTWAAMGGYSGTGFSEKVSSISECRDSSKTIADMEMEEGFSTTTLCNSHGKTVAKIRCVHADGAKGLLEDHKWLPAVCKIEVK